MIGIICWAKTRWKDKFPCLLTLYLFTLLLATLQGNNVKLITVWFCGFFFLTWMFWTDSQNTEMLVCFLFALPCSSNGISDMD